MTKSHQIGLFFLLAQIRAIRGFLLSLVYLCTVDFGLWTLDCGLRTLDFGLWTLDVGLWTLDFGRWTFFAVDNPPLLR